MTGAGGFIGSHVSEMLVREGHEVRAMVRYNSMGAWGWLDAAPDDIRAQLEVFSGDIRDPHGVRTAMTGCDTVLHLAALIAIPYSYHSPATYIDTNITGTLNVVQAARDLGVGRVVHTSTSEVYGTAQFAPITEEHPVHGQSPYSASKIGADQIALSFERSFATPVVIVRPFNTFGPRQSARAVIPAIISQIAAGRRAIRLGSVTPTRDFCFVRDTAAGFVAAAGAENVDGEIINIGNGHEISIADTAMLIAEVMGAKITIETDEQRIRPEKSEVERLWASTEKAEKLLGWAPRYRGAEGLKKGIAETAEWFADADNMKRYRPDTYSI